MIILNTITKIISKLKLGTSSVTIENFLQFKLKCKVNTKKYWLEQKAEGRIFYFLKVAHASWKKILSFEETAAESPLPLKPAIYCQYYYFYSRCIRLLKNHLRQKNSYI